MLFPSSSFPPLLFFCVILVLCAQGSASPAVITQAPSVVRRDDSTDWTALYYFENEDTVDSYTCSPTQVWSENDNYGNCCPTSGGCWFATTCFGSSSVVLTSSVSRSTVSCDVGLQCFPDYVYEDQDDNEAATWYGCATPRDPTYFYLVSPSIGALTSSPTTDITTTTHSPSPSSPNLAWVAGVVIGVVFLVVLTGILVWYIRRTKNNNIPNQSVLPGPPQGPPQNPHVNPPLYSPGYSYQTQNHAQLPVGGVQGFSYGGKSANAESSNQGDYNAQSALEKQVPLPPQSPVNPVAELADNKQ